MVNTLIELIPKGCEQGIFVLSKEQKMHCFQGTSLYKTYSVSTAKNGLGEKSGSECTPRGWHRVHNIIGLDKLINAVFIGRQWTGEIYSDALAVKYPERDWILTRIIQLDGLELGFNQGGDVDSLQRYIYIHGTPDSTKLGVPGSHGCIRMANVDIIELATWVNIDALICVI